MSKENASQARRRAEIILQVRSGQITASEGAKILGVSRKTYYQWEERALRGMLQNLENRKAGRPSNPEPDLEKLQLEKKVADLERKLDLMAETYDLRKMLDDLRAEDQPAPKTKKSRKGTKKKR